MAADIANQTTRDHQTEAEGSKISSGSWYIDQELGGGIEAGSLTLVEGPSASGKSVLAQQLVWGALWTHHRVVLYTEGQTVKNRLRQMEGIGLDVLDFLLMGRLKVPTNQVSEWNTAQALKELAQDIERNKYHDLVIVDSLTPMVTSTSVPEIIAFFEQCRDLCGRGKTIVITLRSRPGDESTMDRIRSMCDADLHLGIDRVGDKLVNVLKAVKVGGATRSTKNVLAFAVEPVIGLRVIPNS